MISKYCQLSLESKLMVLHILMEQQVSELSGFISTFSPLFIQWMCWGLICVQKLLLSIVDTQVSIPTHVLVNQLHYVKLAYVSNSMT